MADPIAATADDQSVKRDFTASRAVASRGNPAAELDALLASSKTAPGGTAAPGGAAPPAAQAAGAEQPPADPSLPLGRQLDQALGPPPAQSAAQEPTLPDRMRALVKDWPAPESGPSFIGAAKDTVEGLAELLEGAHGDLPVGRDLSDKAKSTLALFAGVSPAAGTGAGIARAAAETAAGAGARTAEEAAASTAGEAAAGAAAAPAGEAAAAGAAKAGEAAPSVATEEAAASAEKPPAVYQLVGRDGAVTAKPTPEIRAQATDYLNGVTGDNPVQASLDRIADPKVMSEAINGVASFIERDGVKPDELLRMGAASIGMAPEDALGALAGKLPSDEQIGAWAMLVNSGAKELGDLAQKAVTSGAAADWEAAVRAYALQNHILEQWTSAGTEMGRAFRARQLAWEARGDFSKTLQDIIKNVGSTNTEDVIRKIASLPTPQAQGALVGALRWMGSRDGLLYGWYNYLLTAKTVVAKATTDALMPIWNVAERYAAEKLGPSAGKPGGVAPGEAGALLGGYVGAFGDAVRAAGRGLMAGRSQFGSDYQTMDGLTKTRMSLLANGSPEILPTTTPTYSALSYLRAALPTSWIAGLDDGAKVFNYRAELRALAYRQGVGKFIDESGAPDAAAVGAHVNDVLSAPPRDLHEQAVTRALRNTFQEPLTGVAAALSDAIDGFNIPIRGSSFEIPAGRILAPFTKVPANFVRFMYRNSPLPAAFPSAAFKAETQFPGAARDLAHAGMGLGTGVALTAAGLAIGGYITGNGPSEPQLRAAWMRAGNQPYSIQVPGQRPVSYPVEPFGNYIGAVADAVDLMKFAKDEDRDQIALSVALGSGRAFLSRSYMSGLSNFMEAVQHPDTQGARWTDQLVASLTVPHLASDAAGAVDPWVRAHYNFMQTVESKLPFVSQNLPHAVTIWGDPIPLKDAFLPPFSGTGAAHMLSKIQLGPDPATVEPIDKWIWDNRQSFPDGPEGKLGITKPGLVQSFSGGPHVSAQLELTPQQLYRFQTLAGNEFKDPDTGLGAKDTLNALVQGRHPDAHMQQEWDDAAPSKQALMTLSTIGKYRGAAKAQLTQEFPDINAALQQGFAQRRQALTAGAVKQPTIGGGP